jgi:hypothetical protein
MFSPGGDTPEANLGSPRSRTAPTSGHTPMQTATIPAANEQNKPGSAHWLLQHRNDPIYTVHESAAETEGPPTLLEAVHALLSLKDSSGMSREAFDG